MGTLLLAEVITKLQRLNSEKQSYSLAQLRNELQSIAAEIERIADSLII